VNAGGLGLDVFALGLNDGGVAAMDMGLSGAFGGQGGYDFHIGPGLGVFNSVVALAATVGGGTDSANLDVSPAWYGYATAHLDLDWAKAFRMEGSFRYKLRSKQTDELDGSATLGFGCFGGDPPCLQITTTGVWSRYPGTQTTGLGILLGLTVYTHID
jgi:hypothetical protein